MALIDELREACKGMSAADHTEFQYECMQIIEFYDRVDVLRVAYEEYKGAYKAALQKETNLEILDACFKSLMEVKYNYYQEKEQLNRVLKRIRKEVNERKELGPIAQEWDEKRKRYLQLHAHVCHHHQRQFTEEFNESKYDFLAVNNRLKQAKRELGQKKKGLK